LSVACCADAIDVTGPNVTAMAGSRSAGSSLRNVIVFVLFDPGCQASGNARKHLDEGL
jgi:hypothetical protein